MGSALVIRCLLLCLLLCITPPYSVQSLPELQLKYGYVVKSPPNAGCAPLSARGAEVLSSSRLSARDNECLASCEESGCTGLSLTWLGRLFSALSLPGRQKTPPMTLWIMVDSAHWMDADSTSWSLGRGGPWAWSKAASFVQISPVGHLINWTKVSD